MTKNTKTPFGLLGFGALLLSLCGCANIATSRTAPDGTRTTFNATTLFGNSSLQKLDVDRQTEKTYGGLKIGSLDNETNTESIKAAGEAFGNALGTALKKSISPVP